MGSSGSAGTQLLRALDELDDEVVVHALLHQQPRTGGAHLALAVEDAPQWHPSAAASRSASANTMFGDLPPSSSVSRFSVSAAVRMRCWPTSVEPVKLILFTSGCFTGASPAMRPLPGSTLNTPGGNTGFECQLADADGGERRELGRLQHDRCCRRPAQVPTFQPTMIIGKFHGMIAPTTPTGSRSVYVNQPGLALQWCRRSSFVAQPEK